MRAFTDVFLVLACQRSCVTLCHGEPVTASAMDGETKTLPAMNVQLDFAAQVRQAVSASCLVTTSRGALYLLQDLRGKMAYNQGVLGSCLSLHMRSKTRYLAKVL